MNDARQRLSDIIARQDAERGRPLTALEKLENLAAALADGADEPCPHCGARDDQPCNVVMSGERCRLETP